MRVPAGLLLLSACALSASAVLRAAADVSSLDAGLDAGLAGVELPPAINLVVVRHAFSCANLEKNFKDLVNPNLSPAKPKFVLDPMLSMLGVRTSDWAKDGLRAYLHNELGGRPFAVWSSVMMRAQETAYYMLAGPAGLPINVVPHVGEERPSVCPLGFCNENTPAVRTAQLASLSARNPGVVERLARGRDFRDTPAAPLPAGKSPALVNAADNVAYDSGISDIKRFVTWIARPGAAERWAGADNCFLVDGVRECNVVLFTHSNFMKGSFGAVKSEISNNAAFVSRLEPYVKKSGLIFKTEAAAYSFKKGFDKLKKLNKQSDKHVARVANVNAAQAKLEAAAEAQRAALAKVQAGAAALAEAADKKAAKKAAADAAALAAKGTAAEKAAAELAAAEAEAEAAKPVVYMLERFGLPNLKLDALAQRAAAGHIYNARASGCPRVQACSGVKPPDLSCGSAAPAVLATPACAYADVVQMRANPMRAEEPVLGFIAKVAASVDNSYLNDAAPLCAPYKPLEEDNALVRPREADDGDAEGHRALMLQRLADYKRAAEQLELQKAALKAQAKADAAQAKALAKAQAKAQAK